MTERAIPVEVIESRIRLIDEQLAALDELRRTRDWLTSLLNDAVDVETPRDLSEEEEKSLTATILATIREYPDLQSGPIARVIQTRGIDVQTKVVQTIIGQQVKKGTLRRSPEGRLRIRP